MTSNSLVYNNDATYFFIGSQKLRPRLPNKSVYYKAAFTRQRFFMNMVTLVFIFTEEMQRLHIVVLSAEVNYAHGMWACHFGKHSKFSTMHCRKCNFVLIDIEVGLLLTFLASMKAKVCLYQKCVSVFAWVFTREQLAIFQVSVFKVST